jgi:hypothetical protein
VALLEEALTLWRSQQNPKWIALTTEALGISHRRLGNRSRAMELFAECQRIFTRQGDSIGLGVISSELGLIAMDEGDLPTAVERHLDAYAFHNQAGSTPGAIESLEWVAIAAGKGGLHQLGVCLFEMMAALRVQMGIVQIAEEALPFENGIAPSRDAMQQGHTTPTPASPTSLEVALQLAADIRDRLAGLGRV